MLSLCSSCVARSCAFRSALRHQPSRVPEGVTTVDSMCPRPIVDSRAVSVCRNAHRTERDHARKAKCEAPAQAEGRKIALKNNTTRLSPAPDQAIRDCWLKRRLAGYLTEVNS